MDHAVENTSGTTRRDVEFDVHAETYHRFMLGVKWMAIHLAVLLVFLVLWFCTSAGFLTAFITALFVFGVGVYAMTHGLAHSTENDNLRSH